MKSNLKADYTKFFKPCLYVALALFCLCAIIVGIFGFNKGYDFVGGTQLVVNFELTDVDTENDEKLLEVQKTIKKIIVDNNATINSFQVQGSYKTKEFVITIKKTSDENIENIRIAINREYNTSTQYTSLTNKSDILGKNGDLTQKTTSIDGFVDLKILLTVISTLLFALVVVTVYALFRVKTRGAITIAFGGVLDTVLTLCFVGLTRLEINKYIFVTIAFVLCLSVYASANLMLRIKDNARNPHNLKLTNKEVANLSVGESLNQTLYTYLGAVVLAVVWCIFGTQNILFALLSCLIGIAVVLATHIYVLPAFWVAISSRKETFTKQGIARVEPVKIESRDKDAEVVEIDDSKETADEEETNEETTDNE